MPRTPLVLLAPSAPDHIIAGPTLNCFHRACYMTFVWEFGRTANKAYLPRVPIVYCMHFERDPRPFDASGKLRQTASDRTQNAYNTQI